jgi:polyferredoxin
MHVKAPTPGIPGLSARKPRTPSKKNLPRWRAASLLAVHLLFALHFLHWKMQGWTLAPLEFSESLYTLHAGIITVGFFFMLAAILATFVFGRFFCGWGCHILALQDLCAWLLARLGIKPKPVRSRAMLWIPAGTFAYMFLWPQIQRLFEGRPQPPLVVTGSTEAWSSFVTSDLLRAMPGPAFTFITFAVCGFAIVYFLGSRSFCYSVCPYGVFFSWTDRVAPSPKVTLGGGCESCGLCTQNCKSGVQVIQEIRAFGAVVDKNCLKSLDCVAVCPTDALQVKFTKPAILLEKAGRAKEKGKKKPARKYDFSLREELLFALAFAALVATYTGLYNRIGILLGVAIAVLGGFGAVAATRALRALAAGEAAVKAAPRRASARIRMAAWTGGLLFAALSAHSAFVHYHAFTGYRLYDRWAAQARDPIPGDAAGLEARERSLDALRTAHAWGLLNPPIMERMLAYLYSSQGEFRQAEGFFRRYLAAETRDVQARIAFGHRLAAEGRPAEASAQYRLAILPDRETDSPEKKSWRAAARSYAAQSSLAAGDTARAFLDLEAAIGDNPGDISLYCNYAMLRFRRGEVAAARDLLLRGRAAGKSECLAYVENQLQAERNQAH